MKSFHEGLTLFFIGTAIASPPAMAAILPHPITLPPGFHLEVVMQGVKGVRFMTWSPRGDLLVSQPRAGKILILRKHGKRWQVHTFASGLDRPHGLAWYHGALYVAETGELLKLRPSKEGLHAIQRTVLTRALPRDGEHWTRTIGIGPDGKLYVSVGSSCNVCVEKNRYRASILRLDRDGNHLQIFARGLRNAVGFAWRPGTKELWATDNGRDWLGNNQPPDELDLVRQGGDYGWPYCYGDRKPDPKFGDRDRCAKTIPPALEFQAHSAPLGICFYEGKMFPSSYRGDAFVAFHGSWNRKPPTGYKIVRVHFHNGRPTGYVDFATGWLIGDHSWGRPVDVLPASDGSLFVTDDAGGRIYRITHPS